MNVIRLVGLLLAAVLATTVVGCCAPAAESKNRSDQQANNPVDVAAIGAAQLFWDSCWVHDTKDLNASLASDSKWDAEGAIKLITADAPIHAISHHSRVMFVVRTLNQPDPNSATVVGDIFEKSGDWNLVEWILLEKGFRFELVLRRGKWLVRDFMFEKR
jgi:hypothetical protein